MAENKDIDNVISEFIKHSNESPNFKRQSLLKQYKERFKGWDLDTFQRASARAIQALQALLGLREVPLQSNLNGAEALHSLLITPSVHTFPGQSGGTTPSGTMTPTGDEALNSSSSGSFSREIAQHMKDMNTQMGQLMGTVKSSNEGLTDAITNMTRTFNRLLQQHQSTPAGGKATKSSAADDDDEPEEIPSSRRPTTRYSSQDVRSGYQAGPPPSNQNVSSLKRMRSWKMAARKGVQAAATISNRSAKRLRLRSLSCQPTPPSYLALEAFSTVPER